MFFIYLLASRPHGTLYAGVNDRPAQTRLGTQEQGRPRIHLTLRRRQVSLVWSARRLEVGDQTREADQGMAANVEAWADRGW